MRALTVWQPWASLIAVGAKPYEFRSWPAPAWIVGQRIAIHAGVRKLWNRRALARARNDALEGAARAATGFLVGDPANGVPLRNPMAHEIAERIRTLKSKEPQS